MWYEGLSLPLLHSGLQLQLRRVGRQMPGSMPGTGPRSGVFLDSGFSEVSGRLASPAFSYFLLGLCDELVSCNLWKYFVDTNEGILFLLFWSVELVEGRTQIKILALNPGHLILRLPFSEFFKCLPGLPAPRPPLPFASDVLCFFESLQGPLWHSSEANESLYKIMFNALN